VAVARHPSELGDKTLLTFVAAGFAPDTILTERFDPTG
jgi:hypothetical protein